MKYGLNAMPETTARNKSKNEKYSTDQAGGNKQKLQNIRIGYMVEERSSTHSTHVICASYSSRELKMNKKPNHIRISIHKTKRRSIVGVVVATAAAAVAAALCIGSKSQFKLRPCLFRHTNTFAFVCLCGRAQR